MCQYGRGGLRRKGNALTKIYYFSGTGNSLWSAKKIAETIGSGGGEYALFNIGVEAAKSEIPVEADAVVLLFPCYAYGLPLVVRRFARKAVFKTPYLAAFVTFGTTPGGTLARLCRILGKKNIAARYFGRIPAAENYTALFGPPNAKATERRLAAQRQATEDAARRVLARETNRVYAFYPFLDFVSLLFSAGVAIFYKQYRLSGACDGCGTCEKICPVSAITMRDRRPVFSAKCEHCQGCLNWCPRQAIQFGRLRTGTPRYHHPGITFAGIRR